MSVIRLLASDVIDQIAAGEVLERPASAVKELMENAIDAQAKHIDVFLESGGLTSIMVVDDGVGMSPDDVILCIQRHATSKLQVLDDLLRIQTHGFRGEALSSMAQVSKLTITSRRQQDDAAMRMVVRGGEIIERMMVGAPVGTCMRVDDLYFNTPARRKFMSSPATEQARCVDAAMRVLLSMSHVGGSVHAHGRRLLHVPAGASHEERIRALLSTRIHGLQGFEGVFEGIGVHGFLSPPSVDRGDGKGLWWFVNGRSVRDKTLQRALADAYAGCLQQGRYPMAVIFITMPGHDVDVNVHPQKSEVRFREPQRVYRAVTSAIAQALHGSHTMLPGAGVLQALQRYGSTQHAHDDNALSSNAPASRIVSAPLRELKHERMSAPAPVQALMQKTLSLPVKNEPITPPLLVLGDAVDSVLVCRQGDVYWMVHGGLLASLLVRDALKMWAEEGKIPRHRLMMPVCIHVNAITREMLKHRAHALQGLGLVVAQAGDTYAVTEIPEQVDPCDMAALVEAVCEAMAAQSGEHGFVVDDPILDVYARMQQPIVTAESLKRAMGRGQARWQQALQGGAAKVIQFYV